MDYILKQADMQPIHETVLNQSCITDPVLDSWCRKHAALSCLDSHLKLSVINETCENDVCIYFQHWERGNVTKRVICPILWEAVICNCSLLVLTGEVILRSAAVCRYKSCPHSTTSLLIINHTVTICGSFWFQNYIHLCQVKYPWMLNAARTKGIKFTRLI